MKLDIRLPIGLLFGLLGALLAIYGVLADPAIYARSLGYNVNLWWGITLLLFGSVLLYLGRRGASVLRKRPEPEGRPAEAPEQEEARAGRAEPPVRA